MRRKQPITKGKNVFNNPCPITTMATTTTTYLKISSSIFPVANTLNKLIFNEEHNQTDQNG